MPLFFFVTEAALTFLQTCFLPEYLIVSHSAAFSNHYACADLWPWIGLGFVFSADEEMGCVIGLVGFAGTEEGESSACLETRQE
jgi:hypothetical protein